MHQKLQGRVKTWTLTKLACMRHTLYQVSFSSGVLNAMFWSPSLGMFSLLDDGWIEDVLNYIVKTLTFFRCHLDIMTSKKDLKLKM